MNHKFKWVWPLLAAALLAALFIGIQSHADVPEPASAVMSMKASEPSLPPASSFAKPYQQAVGKLLSSGNYRMHITATRKLELDGQTIIITSEQSSSCKNRGQKDMMLSMMENRKIGSHQVTLTEMYKDGTAYLSLNNSFFSCMMQPKDYISRMMPLQMLDPDLYDSIKVRANGTMKKVGFYQPKGAEGWASQYTDQITLGYGTALLDSDGTLVQSNYFMQGTLNGHKCELNVEVRYEPVIDQDLTLMKIPTDCTPVQNLNVPLQLEMATGYLVGVDHLSSRIESSIDSQAGNLVRSQVTELSIHDLQGNLDATISADVELTDHNQAGTTTKYSQVETFHNGKYHLDVTQGSSSNPSDPDISEEIMKKYCKDTLVGSIILPGFIEDVEIIQQEDAYLLTFPASEKLASVLSAEACKILYQDPNVLSSVSTSYETTLIQGLLRIDKSSGLPLGAGLSYAGSHTIEGTTYSLSYEISQTYKFGE